VRLARPESRAGKLALGIATAWPILWMLAFFAFLFVMVLAEPDEGPPGIPPLFVALFVLHFATIIFIFVLTALFMINVFGNPRVASDKKALWAVVIFLGNVFAFPVYWYLYVWREPPAGAIPAAGPSPLEPSSATRSSS